MAQRDITVLINTTTEPKKFAGIRILEQDKTWSANNNTGLLKTISGKINYNGTTMQLNDSSNAKEIVRLTSFIINDGQTGEGVVGDTAEPIIWKIKGIAEI